ncbi:MAG: hypothetical protein ACK4LQ_00020 [Pararhodobacter sp.]
MQIRRNEAAIAAARAEALARQRSAAIAEVNRLIGAVRAQYITPIPGQEMLYLAKRAEAAAFLALDPAPETLDAFPLIAAEIGITAPSAAELAQIWLNLGALWEGIAAQLEALRLGAIKVIEEAGDGAAIESAVGQVRAAVGE